MINLNDPADYRRARSRPPPEIAVQCLGVLAGEGGAEARTVRAATLAGAAAAVSLPSDQHMRAALNGDQVAWDAHLPLLRGDAVAFSVTDAGG